MKVFLDTNVLVSAFATRGLCADLLRHVLSEHELVVGEVVLDELQRVLVERIHLSVETVYDILHLLREHRIVSKPSTLPALEIRDKDDAWVFASALSAGVDVLITGDKDLLDLREQTDLRIITPRGFWDLVRSGG